MRNPMQKTITILTVKPVLLATTLLLSACGGSSNDGTTSQKPQPDKTNNTNPNTENTPQKTAPGGLYIGYYAEDPANNPEDPTVGVVYLSLPKNDSTFAGQMSFTFVGCQTTSIATISGDKTQKTLTGTWSGNIDHKKHSGKFTGKYNTTNKVYTGTYTNDAGKQYQSIPNCISYYVAANGKWQLIPLNATYPLNAAGLTIKNSKISTTATSAKGRCSISVLDKEVASKDIGNAIKTQFLKNGSINNLELPAFGGTKGKTYVANIACTAAADNKVTYLANKDFVFE